MGWVSIIIILLICCIPIILRSNKEVKAGVIYSIWESTYIGGYDDVAGGKKAEILLFKNKLDINFVTNMSNSKSINIENINTIKIMSQELIQNEISIGKMLIFGVLAFGMRDNKTTVNNYLVVNYNEDNLNYNVILSVLSNSAMENLIKKYKEIKTGD